MKSHKHLFSQALAHLPAARHAAAHSHHLRPDVVKDAQDACTLDALCNADLKWDRFFGQIYPSAQAHVARLLVPAPRDYCLLKPKHSAFFGTVLATLLEHLGVRRLVVCGVTAQQCVLFTANDAYVRDLELAIPRDCIASESPAKVRFALRYFREVLGADLAPSVRVRFRPRRRL